MANINQNQYGYMNNQTQNPIQYPYNNLLNNNNNMSSLSYDNYLNRINQFQNLQQNQFLKCRPVSSREQAIAFQIDLDGSLWVFPNLTKGKIYTKQINNDGSATFNTYILSEEEENGNDLNQYVTKNEFNKAIQSIMSTINPSSPQESNNQNLKNNLSF